VGALSVWALFVLLFTQATSGLVSDDEIPFSAPLTHLVSDSTVSLATSYHADIGKWILLSFAVLHFCAIFLHAPETSLAQRHAPWRQAIGGANTALS
jgi:cytochrome b